MPNMKVCKTALMLTVLIRLSGAESRVKSRRVQLAAHVEKTEYLTAGKEVRRVQSVSRLSVAIAPL